MYSSASGRVYVIARPKAVFIEYALAETIVYKVKLVRCRLG